MRSLAETALRILSYRGSLRAAATRRLVRGLNFVPYPLRLAIDAVERPHYGYCVFQAATLAKQLGHTRISVIEFGVAGGNGLINLENHAIEAKRHLGVDLEVYGFDTGVGLPKPLDYRDQPYHWRGELFQMDQVKLRERLRFAKLVIGEISQTLPSFINSYDPGPIAAVLIDVDYYSSTIDSLAIFDIERRAMLPRIFMYFDDLIGSEAELHSSFTGERLAIAEFNQTHQRQKISKAFHLKDAGDYFGTWRKRIFIYHDFDHPEYCNFTHFNRATADTLALES